MATSPTATARETSHYDTIVVGAGMSGLACASRLYEDPTYHQGEKSLLVLEGRDRIGGRINSVHVNGCRLDTGANWIHGVGTKDRPNPLMSILPHKRYRELSGMVAFRPPEPSKSPGIGQADVENGWVDVRAPFGSSVANLKNSESPVIPAESAATMFGSMWMMIGMLHELAESKPTSEAKRTSILQALHEIGVIESVLKKIPKEYHAAFSSMPAFVEAMEAGPLVAQSAEHPEDQPGLSLLEFAIDDFEGEQVFLQDGYIGIINEVAKELVAADLIRTGIEVKQIDWEKKPIVIKTNESTYSADKVVCTLPLGVLQHSIPRKPSSSFSDSKKSLFSPELPQSKHEAVTSLGFGTLDKIFLTYSTPWWEQDPYISLLKPGIVRQPMLPEKPPSTQTSAEAPDSLMGFTTALPGISLHPDGTTSPGLRPLSLLNLHSIAGFPALCAFVSCANATHIETLSDDAAADFLHQSLTSWFGREVPRPEGVHVTRWSQDPFSRGSYSHMITGVSEAGHRDGLAACLRNSKGGELRFAGEHTSREHFATVHGALLSGWREADAILRKG